MSVCMCVCLFVTVYLCVCRALPAAYVTILGLVRVWRAARRPTAGGSAGRRSCRNTPQPGTCIRVYACAYVWLGVYVGACVW